LRNLYSKWSFFICRWIRIEENFLIKLYSKATVAIFLVNYKEVNNLGDGVTETSYLPVVDYIVTVLRFGIISSLLGLLYGWLIFKK
jgi:hypothetical protein